MIVLAHNPKTEISAYESIGCIGEGSKREAILLSLPPGSGFGDSGGCYLKQKCSTEVRLQFFCATTTGINRCLEFTGN